MATTRSSRHRRSRSDLTEPRGPQERSQVFAHATQNDSGQRTVQDMAILSQAFGNFFQGLQRAGEIMMESQHQDRMHEIQQENRLQQHQGAADAESGAAPAMPDDMDYMAVYSRTKGINVGTKAAMDYLAALDSQPLGTDPEKFREEWFKKEFGGGTNDPIHDAAAFATFKNKTDQANLAFRINNAKHQREQGVAALSEEIFSKAEDAGIDDLRDWIVRSIELNLGDPVKGRALVLSALKQAATTPRALQRVNALLHSKGYMEDGRAFADAFPLSAQELSEESTRHYLSSLSAEAFDAYAKIEQRLRDPEVMNDELQLADLVMEVGATRDRFGGESVHDSLVGKIQKQMDKVIAAKAEFNAFVLKGIHGGYPVDQEATNKHLPTVIQRRLAITVGEGATPLSSPQAAEETARVVAAYHSIDSTTRASMSAAVIDANNPQAQANAFRFFARLEAEGKDPSQFMTSDAVKSYTAIQRLLRTTANGNLELALQRYNADPNAAKDAQKEVDWPVLLDRPEEKRETLMLEVAEEIRNQIATQLGITGTSGIFSDPDRVVMMPDVQQELLSDFAFTLRDYKARGIPDAQEAAMEAIAKGLARNYLTLPGADGTVQIVRRRNYPAFEKMGIVGPGLAFNPHTGDMENTLDVFRADIEEAKRAMPGLFGSPEMFYVQKGRGGVRADGSFQLMDGASGQPLMFAPGQQVALSVPDGPLAKKIKKVFGARIEEGKAITLSNDPAEAQRELESILPPHFKIEVLPSDLHGPVFRVFYQFHTSSAEDIATIAARYKRRVGKPSDPRPFANTEGGAAAGMVRNVRKP